MCYSLRQSLWLVQFGSVAAAINLQSTCGAVEQQRVQCVALHRALLMDLTCNDCLVRFPSGRQLVVDHIYCRPRHKVNRISVAALSVRALSDAEDNSGPCAAAEMRYTGQQDRDGRIVACWPEEWAKGTHRRPKSPELCVVAKAEDEDMWMYSMLPKQEQVDYSYDEHLEEELWKNIQGVASERKGRRTKRRQGPTLDCKSLWVQQMQRRRRIRPEEDIQWSAVKERRPQRGCHRIGFNLGIPTVQRTTVEVRQSAATLPESGIQSDPRMDLIIETVQAIARNTEPTQATPVQEIITKPKRKRCERPRRSGGSKKADATD